MMKIRLPFAGVFFLLLVLAGYAGLSSLQIDVYINDKLLHLLTFFALTLVFYWILDTTRRRALHLTLIVCTAVLGVGSEFLQGLLPNGRVFDIFDLVANVVGSLAAVGLCAWYHRRMLERKRQRKQYSAVPGEEGAEDDEEDLELGVRTGEGDSGAPAAGGGRSMTLEEEVDKWDENAVDAWDEGDGGDVGDATAPGKANGADANGEITDTKKRAD